MLKIVAVLVFTFLCIELSNIYINTKYKVNFNDFDGVPVSVLVDFIFNEKGFPVKESKKTLNINTKTHAVISRKLQNWKVIRKQLPNNKLILADDITPKKLKLLLRYGSSFEIYRNQEKAIA